MSRATSLFTATATAVMTLAVASAHATPIVGPVSVSASIGDLDNTRYAIANLINQSGLSSSYTSGVTDFSTFVATATLTTSPSSSNGWASTTNNQFPAFIDFDLGALTLVSRMALWNDTDTQALGAFEIFASADATFTTLISLGAFAGVVQSVGTLAQVFDMTDATTQYIRISGSPIQQNNGLLNIGEIAFEGAASSVPEPGTLALFGISLAGLGLIRKRKSVNL